MNYWPLNVLNKIGIFLYSNGYYKPMWADRWLYLSWQRFTNSCRWQTKWTETEDHFELLNRTHLYRHEEGMVAWNMVQYSQFGARSTESRHQPLTQSNFRVTLTGSILQPTSLSENIIETSIRCSKLRHWANTLLVVISQVKRPSPCWWWHQCL